MTADTDALLRDLNRDLVRADVIERDDLTLTQVDISVVMPCLNEEDSVAACVEHALEGIRRASLTGEVVVCDNGSTDASVSRAAAAGARVVHQPQKGYGSAYRKGFEAARGRILVMGDSDGSYDFSQLDRLVAKLDEGYDYVLGSRFAGTILPGAMPWLHRYVGNPVLTGLLNLFFGLDTSDAHSGMRAFTREAYDRLGVATEGMEFASEIVINAAHAGLRVAEVPITYHPRAGESKLNSWRDGWRHLRFMLLLAPNWLFVLPGTVLFLLGTIGEVALLPGPLNLTAERTLGVHFSVLFTLMAILGYQQLMFGVFTKAYAHSRGAVGRPDRLLGFVDRTFSLERGLVIGLLMFLIGAGIDATVLVHWLASHMGSLDALRPVLLSLTLMTLGAQTAFGSFFLSLFHGTGPRLSRRAVPAQDR
jgi:glycosyltransferase involved in cell wall biosynthesis